MMKHYVRLACFVGGALFGSAGVKLLTSKDAKKAYTHITAAGLRMKDSVMETVTTVQENAADILASAKDINEARAAQEAESQVEGQEPERLPEKARGLFRQKDAVCCAQDFARILAGGARGGGSPPRVGSNALNALHSKVFSERSEDFSAAQRRESNGIFADDRKVPGLFRSSEGSRSGSLFP